jgi:hypothetical protein
VAADPDAPGAPPAGPGGEIRLRDLRDPVRSPQEQAAYEFGCSLEVGLDPEELLASARARTGLHDLGDDTLVDRLVAQCRAVDADTGLSGLGRLIVRRRLLGLLAARLRFEDHVARRPEALEVDLEPPVVVVGLPRSGTTHLVNLLAADPRVRSLPWWECVEPTPFPGDGPGRDGVDPRYLRCLADYEAGNDAAPLTRLMHDRHPSTIEEECELMDLDLCTYTLEWHARVPSWREHYLGLDQDAHYAFLVRELRVLAHLRGPRRFVLKCPQHLEQLGPLLRTFPGATIVLTLRDPVAVFQSTVTMLAYGDRLRRVRIDLDDLADIWQERLGLLLDRYLEDRHLLEGRAVVPVEFHAFMADPVATVTRIWEAAGWPVDDAALDAVRSHADAHPRGRDGRVVYDLRADIGRDPDRVRERYRAYLDHHREIRTEVH